MIDEKGFSTLWGLCFLLPMIFIAGAFFSLLANEQQMEILLANGAKAQYIAESGIEKTLDKLCQNTDLYNELRREAQGQSIVYKRELWREEKEAGGHYSAVSVYFRYFNYDASYFTLSAVGSFDNASKRATAYIKEKDNVFSITRWEYHEQRF